MVGLKMLPLPVQEVNDFADDGGYSILQGRISKRVSVLGREILWLRHFRWDCLPQVETTLTEIMPGIWRFKKFVLWQQHNYKFQNYYDSKCIQCYLNFKAYITFRVKLIVCNVKICATDLAFSFDNLWKFDSKPIYFGRGHPWKTKQSIFTGEILGLIFVFT